MERGGNTMKRLKIFSLILVLCFVLTGCYSNLGKKDIFKRYEDDFEVIKDVFVTANLDLGERGEKIYSLIQNEQGVITGLFSCPIHLTQEEYASLNRLAEMFTQSFNFIAVTNNRISFGGDGAQMIVYSADGKRPSYFHAEDDGVRYRVEKLSEHWFYLYMKTFGF